MMGVVTMDISYSKLLEINRTALLTNQILKCALDLSILYKLWCSGDIESNPGPTLRILQKLHDSKKERNWIYDVCSTTLKCLKKMHIDSKSDGMWKTKPDNWPSDMPFYDPRNKPKGQSYNAQTDEKLLHCLLELCRNKNITISDNLQEEIVAWKKDKQLLFKLFISRQETDSIKTANEGLFRHKDDPEFKQSLSKYCFELNFSTSTFVDNTKGLADIVRDLAVTFCRLSKNISVSEKSDGIWKQPPIGWRTSDEFYSPFNAGKRHGKNQDKTLVDNLLMHCETQKIHIPVELEPLTKAWKQKDSHRIQKLYSIWSNLVVIEHSLKYLQLETILDSPQVQNRLAKIGLTLKEKFWNLQNPRSSTTVTRVSKCQDSNKGLEENKAKCSFKVSPVAQGSLESLSSNSSILAPFLERSDKVRRDTQHKIGDSIPVCKKQRHGNVSSNPKRLRLSESTDQLFLLKSTSNNHNIATSLHVSTNHRLQANDRTTDDDIANIATLIDELSEEYPLKGTDTVNGSLLKETVTLEKSTTSQHKSNTTENIPLRIETVIDTINSVTDVNDSLICCTSNTVNQQADTIGQASEEQNVSVSELTEESIHISDMANLIPEELLDSYIDELSHCEDMDAKLEKDMDL